MPYDPAKYDKISLEKDLVEKARAAWTSRTGEHLDNKSPLIKAIIESWLSGGKEDEAHGSEQNGIEQKLDEILAQNNKLISILQADAIEHQPKKSPPKQVKKAIKQARTSDDSLKISNVSPSHLLEKMKEVLREHAERQVESDKHVGLLPREIHIAICPDDKPLLGIKKASKRIIRTAQKHPDVFFLKQDEYKGENNKWYEGSFICLREQNDDC